MDNRLRADNVGSLLRPRYLREAMDSGVDGAELGQLQDRAVREVVELQREVGLPVVSDGEFRRRLWYHSVLAVCDGFDPDRFERVYTDAQGRAAGRHGGPVVVEKLRRKASQVELELEPLLEATDLPVKITQPSPSHFLSYWTEGVSDVAYETREAFMDDLVAIMNEDARALAARGASYLQLDAPKYTYFTDERLYPDRDRLGPQLAEYVRNDLRVFEGVSGVTTGMHVCRGNYRGMYGSSTPYAEFAEVLFSEARYDRLLLEYDDARAGGFDALRWVPDGVTVVLGLVSTKVPELETRDDLLRKIEEAATYVPIERLAISTQCGFASAYEGNEIGFDDQRHKLELVVETAREVWGDVEDPVSAARESSPSAPSARHR
ncbi:MAG TPA: cobalamin-independent methionine synthase II family protein [Solirubrobacteraceae bacterium]|nr:cobalamin-independent methionine synthase II family protein [Solirubrobacteraceae bacterium]